MSSDPSAFAFLEDLPPVGPPCKWEFRPGTSIAWNEYGDPSGEPLFYYHGWPSSRLQARALHHLAAARGLRVIALDRPGMGRSTRVKNRRLEDWAEVIEAFADAHGIGRFVQLGVSGGGPYVLPCLAKLQDRVAGSAVLCGAVPLGPGWERCGMHPLYRLMIHLQRLPRQCFTPAFRAASYLARHNPSRPPLSWLARTLPEGDREIVLRHPHAVPVFTASFVEGVAQGGPGVFSDADVYLSAWTLDLSSIRQPVRYWHGGKDGNIPLSLVRAFVAKMPGATLTVEENLAHFSLALHKAEAALDYLLDEMGC